MGDMYRRNQSREYEREKFGGGIDDISEDEQELYRYDLPPKYDGSRFRRAEMRDTRNYPSSVDVEAKEEYDFTTAEEERSDTLTDAKELNEPKRSEFASDSAGNSDLIKSLASMLGYEEVLLIALLLILSEDGRCGGEIILLLTILLLGKQTS